MVRKCRKAKGMVEAGCVRSGKESTYMQLRSRRIFYVIRSANNSSDGVSPSSCCGSNVVDVEEEEREGDTVTWTYQRSRSSTKRKLFQKILGERESMENAAEFNSMAVEKSAISECCCSSGKRTSSLTMEEEEKTATMTEQEELKQHQQPTQAEIEEFFVEAEKQLNDKFNKKYNFDFGKEKPLEGRYEWVQLSD